MPVNGAGRLGFFAGIFALHDFAQAGDFTGETVLVLQGVGKGDGFHDRLDWLRRRIGISEGSR